MNKYNLINLIDILRTKTYIINMYNNNINDVYFDSDSYEKVDFNINSNNDNYTLTTGINSTEVTYNIYKNIKSNVLLFSDNNIYPEPIYILDNSSAQYKKNIKHQNLH